MGWGESEFTVVGDNKILTVSYGTFSCTLEGFEDPFSTMKNIAEYFRDLAAGDRFFGAEPPQPDPEMLQSIAEQTIKARVNAQLSDNNLVLSQQGASGSVAQAAAPVAAAAVAPQVMPAPAAAPGVETVAEKLQRIRAVVSRETAQDAFFSEDQHVEEFTAETTVPFSSFEDEQDAPVVAEAPVADLPVADLEIEDTVVEDTVSEETVSEDVVEDSPVEAQEDTVADETSEIVEDAPEVDLDDVIADVEDVAEAEEAPVADEVVADAVEDTVETVSEEAEFEDEDAALESALASITAEDDTAEEIAEDVAQSDTLDEATARQDAAEAAVDNVLGRLDDDADEEKADAAPRRRIVVQKITREDLKAARAEAEKSVSDDVVEEAPAPLSDELEPEAEADLMRELAALQEDAPENAVAEEVFTDEDDADDDIDLDDGLSEVLSGMVAEDASAHEAEAQEAARAVRLARREAVTEEGENAVERLMDTTSSRLDGDESSSRRASIAHLKAAVAATKADASLTEEAQKQEARERDQYAEDLARVVRPERAQPRNDGTKTDRPAPLVLVSELRIDKDENDAATEDAPAASEGASVRPRRVSRSAIDEADDLEEADGNIFNDPDQSSFAEYAAAANALDLPDLLEAAAAYYTYVESTEQFTRPMLMRKIASVSDKDGFSREAGLRSFGTLLREGKLVKGTDGKFVIAKSSRFTPEARYAGE